MPALPDSLSFLLQIAVKIISAWWWVVLPFFLWKIGVYFWLYWRRELWLIRTFKPILFEIKLPKEVLKPVRAMENVISGLHQACFEPPNWIEKWWEGQVQLSLHFEIVSIGGDIHFYLRSHQKYRDPIEANIYSQYPEAEITVAEDYVKYVPQDIPNKDWDFWATDYKFTMPNPYPILTYKTFETETEALEEKRVDPVSALLENLSKIKPGEQFWLQLSAEPMGKEAGIEPFLKEGIALRDKLAKRTEEEKPTSGFWEAANVVITGKVEEEKKVKVDIMPPEMRLTPGEKDIVQGVENKIARPAFSCNSRFIYLGKKDVWFKPNMRLGFGFYANYNTLNMNSLVPSGKSLTKVKSRPPFNIFDKRRLYLRQRRIFRLYKERFHPYFPLKGRWPEIFVLNSEELASIYHFPSWQVSPVPGVSRVEVRKRPPSELPME